MEASHSRCGRISHRTIPANHQDVCVYSGIILSYRCLQTLKHHRESSRHLRAFIVMRWHEITTGNLWCMRAVRDCHSFLCCRHILAKLQYITAPFRHTSWRGISIVYINDDTCRILHRQKWSWRPSAVFAWQGHELARKWNLASIDVDDLFPILIGHELRTMCSARHNALYKRGHCWWCTKIAFRTRPATINGSSDNLRIRNHYAW